MTRKYKRKNFFVLLSRTMLDDLLPLVVEGLLALISLGCLGLLAIQPFKNPPPISLR
jgi:hypothetical protein